MSSRRVVASLGAVVALSASFAADVRADEDLVAVFAAVDQAVVVIDTVETVAEPGRSGTATASGLGSGVLVDAAGHVVTAAHVVQTADRVTVRYRDDTRVAAVIVTTDPTTDLALLRVDTVPEGIRPVRLGDSDRTAVGERVFVVGAPYGLDHSLSVGHISGRHRDNPDIGTGIAPRAELFQTDAAINQGNSGGPMFDMQGRVVGIVSHILSRSGGFEGLGFAVTSNTVQRRLFEARPFWSGVTATPIGGALAAALNVPQEYGALVQHVSAGSAAEKIGLRPGRFPVTIQGREFLLGGDIILSVDGIEIGPGNRAAIEERIRNLDDRQRVVVRILRAGRVESIDAYGFLKND